MTDKTYEGWANRQTWNVSLWLNNDEGLYHLMQDYCRETLAEGKSITYTSFINWAGLVGERTPDGVKFSGKRLERKELGAMLRELGEGVEE